MYENTYVLDSFYTNQVVPVYHTEKGARKPITNEEYYTSTRNVEGIFFRAFDIDNESQRKLLVEHFLQLISEIPELQTASYVILSRYANVGKVNFDLQRKLSETIDYTIRPNSVVFGITDEEQGERLDQYPRMELVEISINRSTQ